jgi:hypothetical protein
MDIVNFSYLVANEIISTTVPDNALLLFGNPDSTRDDGYKTWAIKFSNFKTELVTDLYSEFLGDNTTVTQITAISTAVTINSASGQITTVSSTLAGGSNAAFTVNNSEVTTASTILLTVEHPGAGIPLVVVDAPPANGSFVIRIYNIDTSAFNNTLTIHFLVIN